MPTWTGAPETRYVPVADADVAYQVVGEGAYDLLHFYGLGAHIDLIWEAPVASGFVRRLASFSRLILFNRRGTGASDAVTGDAIPTWEDWTDDVHAVLDAAGSERTAIFASLDGGPIALLYAAMHPERVSALVLHTTAARYTQTSDYPIGATPDEVTSLVELVRSSWGTPEFVSLTAPSMAGDQEYLRFGAKWFRASGTPRAAATQFEYTLRNLDVRHVLPLIQVPTLVLHVKDNILCPIEHGHYLGEHIPGATFLEVPGSDIAITPVHLDVADTVAQFLTGHVPAVEPTRILATVLFTDIVGSTERAAIEGDAKGRALLDSHDHLVREQLRRFSGREINTTGDGFLASFDGPARAIRCARALIQAAGELGIEIRAGLHSGECELRGDDLAGLSVHIAARIGALAGSGEVVVSATVKDLVIGSGIQFDDRGEHFLKGVPGAWRLFAVTHA
jgi:class 3 adenylate cyclase